MKLYKLQGSSHCP